MSSRPKVLTVFGTRPEAIKLAPVVRRLAARADALASVIVVTAQHRQMLDQVLELFAIRPDYDLDLMQPGQSPSEVLARVLGGLQPILRAEAPHILLVQGDTTTVLAAALAAFYERITVGHVEAGLRTGDKAAPFPEEMNRRLTSALADLHFAPTALARDNLLREHVAPERIHITGNTVIDALLDVVGRPMAAGADPLAGLDLDGRRIVLVTAHRRESWGAALRAVCAAVAELVGRFDDIAVVFSVHPNPEVRRTVEEELAGTARVHLVAPLDYEPFVRLMGRAHLILTDSGGIQEEAPSLGKPVLVLRDVTERPEGVDAGTLRLVGTEAAAIVAAASHLLSDPVAYGEMARASNPYGDGHAAERIVAVLERWLAGAR